MLRRRKLKILVSKVLDMMEAEEKYELRMRNVATLRRRFYYLLWLKNRIAQWRECEGCDVEYGLSTAYLDECSIDLIREWRLGINVYAELWSDGSVDIYYDYNPEIARCLSPEELDKRRRTFAFTGIEGIRRFIERLKRKRNHGKTFMVDDKLVERFLSELSRISFYVYEEVKDGNRVRLVLKQVRSKKKLEELHELYRCEDILVLWSDK